MNLSLPTSFRPGRHPGGGLLRFFRSPRDTWTPFLTETKGSFVPEIPFPQAAFTEWAQWTASLCGVTTEVPAATEDNWREWADRFVASGVMQQYRLPDGRGFERWEDWAVNLKMVYNGP